MKSYSGYTTLNQIHYVASYTFKFFFNENISDKRRACYGSLITQQLLLIILQAIKAEK